MCQYQINLFLFFISIFYLYSVPTWTQFKAFLLLIKFPVSFLKTNPVDVQAIECYLANINPTDDQNISAFVLEELVSGQVVQARMIGTNEQGVPMIHLYRNSNGQTTMVNRELVDRDCAQWLDTTIVQLESPLDHPSIM